MLKKILIAATALTCGVTWAGSTDVFKIAPEDEGKISKEFIAKIRAAAGDKHASHASDELHRYVTNQIETLSSREREDMEIEYINYLERLYKRAFEAALKKMSATQKAEIIRQEKEWSRKVVHSPKYKVHCPYEGIVSFSVASQSRYIRLYYNRTRYWACPPARRAEIDEFRGLQISTIYGKLPIEYNEVRRITPLDLHNQPVDPRQKTYLEDLATLPMDFCRKTKIGKDTYHIGILIPNNDYCTERSTQGYERVLVIWKNRQYHACYYLPHHADIRSLQIKGSQVSVKYVQIDEFFNHSKRKSNPTQIFTIDFTYEIFAPVRITNWLDYYTDGLGNVHKRDCCKGKYDYLRKFE